MRQRSSSSPLLESLQMFGLHETRRGSSYVPPAILVHLSQLHKKGTLYLPPRKAAPSAPAKDDGAKADAPKLDASKSPAPTPASPTPSPLPTKIFFAAAALALVISTCTGLFMSWKVCAAQSCGWWDAFGGNRPAYCSYCFYDGRKQFDEPLSPNTSSFEGIYPED